MLRQTLILRYYLSKHNKLGLKMLMKISVMFCYTTCLFAIKLKGFEVLRKFKMAAILKQEVGIINNWSLLY